MAAKEAVVDEPAVEEEVSAVEEAVEEEAPVVDEPAVEEEVSAVEEAVEEEAPVVDELDAKETESEEISEKQKNEN